MANTPNVTGKKYWRSLNQLADTKEFHEWVHHEFPANATEMLDGNSRQNLATFCTTWVDSEVRRLMEAVGMTDELASTMPA